MGVGDIGGMSTHDMIVNGMSVNGISVNGMSVGGSISSVSVSINVGVINAGLISVGVVSVGVISIDVIRVGGSISITGSISFGVINAGVISVGIVSVGVISIDVITVGLILKRNWLWELMHFHSCCHFICHNKLETWACNAHSKEENKGRQSGIYTFAQNTVPYKDSSRLLTSIVHKKCQYL